MNYIQIDLFSYLGRYLDSKNGVEFLHNINEADRIENSVRMAEFYKPILENIIKEIEMEDKFPLFGNVMFSTCNYCNGNCSFCQASKRYNRQPIVFMNDCLIEKVIKELSGLKYSGRITMQGLNEPFFDKRMNNIILNIARNVPDAKIHIITNGTLLSAEILNEIYPYINKIHIDNYKENVPENIKQCLDSKGMFPDGGKKIVFSMRKEEEILCQFGLNECGRTVKPGIDCGCILPYNTIALHSNGKVTFCISDVAQRYVVGDINEDTLADIWFGKKMNQLRKMIRSGRKNLDLCKECDMFCF